MNGCQTAAAAPVTAGSVHLRPAPLDFRLVSLSPSPKTLLCQHINSTVVRSLARPLAHPLASDLPPKHHKGPRVGFYDCGSKQQGQSLALSHLLPTAATDKRSQTELWRNVSARTKAPFTQNTKQTSKREMAPYSHKHFCDCFCFFCQLRLMGTDHLQITCFVATSCN